MARTLWILPSVLATAVLVAGLFAAAAVQAVYEPDVNKDGRVNSTDQLMVLKRMPGADVNHDGRIDSTDMLIVVKAMNKMPLAPTPTPPPSGTRDKLKQPFASDSPWNMPLGADLVLVPANLPRTFVSVDEEPVIMAPGAPLRDAYENGDWPASCRVVGARWLGTVPVPDGYVVPPGSSTFKPNYAGGVLLQDGRTIMEMQYATRCADWAPLTMGIQRDRHDIYGSGVGFGVGGHGGSSLSGVGGSLRVWEVNGNDPIRHALKLTLSVALLSQQEHGYRWPAANGDASYNTPGGFSEYLGSNPALRMGSLLAIPRAVDINALGLKTPMAKRLAWTLQNYGAYVVDSSPAWWTGHLWAVEYGAQQGMRARWGYAMDSGDMSADSLALLTLLQVVNDNGPGSVGGTGARVQPLLPPIGN